VIRAFREVTLRGLHFENIGYFCFGFALFTTNDCIK
jgi:hypothetical protein